MINTSYHCDYFIDFHEKFANYINDNNNNIHLKDGFDLTLLNQNFESVFPKKEINSLYVSSGVKNLNTNIDFLLPIFERIIEGIYDKIIWFKKVHLTTFINLSKLYYYLFPIAEKNISRLVVKHLVFIHIHKDLFDLKYDYKEVMKDFFREIVPILDSKIEEKLITNEIIRLKKISLIHEDFYFLNDIVLTLRGVKFKDNNKEQELRKIEIFKKHKLLNLKKVFNTIKPKWLLENNNDNFLSVIKGKSIPEKNSFLIKKPVQYFFFLLFLLEDLEFINEERIIVLIKHGVFTHYEGKNISIEALSNAKTRFKSFDITKDDNKKSEGCVKDLIKIYLSYNQ